MSEEKGSSKVLIGALSVCTLGLLISTIVLAVQSPESEVKATLSNVPDSNAPDVESIFMAGENKCAGAKLPLDNVDCIHVKGPQSGANVTKGYVGGMDVEELKPVTDAYFKNSMCPVNVHWHLGTEHYSVGEYDEEGTGPHGGIALEPASDSDEDYDDGGANKTYSGRALAADKDVRGGFRCRHYDESNEIFTKPFEWKHCVNMEVGETYEVHWPHSAVGACGTVDQYQTPFYDGVFCNLNAEAFGKLGAQDIANAVGVQAQIFTIVNDEQYFYPDLIRGWMIDDVDRMGKDIAIYTGSTTGTTRSNKICSQYAPITWQVDRKCHKISASSFDKLCYDMKMQRDDMSGDLYAHGSRELVKDSLVANNQQDRKLTKNRDHEYEQVTAAELRNLRVHGKF